MGSRRRGNRPTRRWNRNETSPGMGSRMAQPRRTRRKASRATPPPAAAPSAPACPPPPDPAPQPAHPDQERRYKAATNRSMARGSPSRTWVKSSEPKKPARKKREQERSTTGSRSRVRIRPTPPAPPPAARMTPPPFIPRAKRRRGQSGADERRGCSCSRRVTGEAGLRRISEWRVFIRSSSGVRV